MLALLLTGAFICPASQVVEVNLSDWRARASKIQHYDGFKKHAQEVGITLTGSDEGKYILKKTSIKAVQITGAKAPDQVIEVIYTHFAADDEEGDSTETEHRFSVLRPLGKNKYCAVGGPGETRNVHAYPCDASYEDVDLGSAPPLLVKYVPLLNARQNAIEVTVLNGSCLGMERSSDLSRQYFAFVDGAIKRVFSATIYSSYYSSPEPASSTYTSQVKLSGGWPRTIEVSSQDLCFSEDDTEGDAAPMYTGGECVNRVIQESFSFDGQTYTRTSRKVRIDNPGARHLANSAYTYIKSKDYQYSIKVSTQALEMTDQPGLRGAVLFNLGLAHESLKHSAKAIKFYQSSLEVRPGNKVVANRLKRLTDLAKKK